jgi:sugar phosphate isomerase/epimerase
MITIGGRAHNMEEIVTVSKFGYPTLEISLDDPAVVSGWIPQLLEIKNTYGTAFLAHYPNEDNPFDLEVLRDKFLPRIKALMEISEQLDIRKATIHFWMDNRWAPADLIRGKIELLLAKQNTSFRFTEDCFPRIAHMHVHDNRGGTSVKDDLHLALGEGSVDYAAIIKSLVNKGYDSTITMEVKPQDMSRTKQTLEDCIRNFQNLS